MAQLETRRRSRPTNNWIGTDHGNNVTSQNGEDGIIERIFELVGIEYRACVDVGAWDGQRFSNTFNLIVNGGWRGILIEADRDRCLSLTENYPSKGLGTVKALNVRVGWGQDDGLDAILGAFDLPKNFDLLAIDIDGNDLHVWAALEVFRPRVVAIEFNPTMPNSCFFVQDADPKIQHGSSILAIVELAKSKGYELAAVTDYNAFFVLADLFPLLNIPDNDLDKMRDIGAFETHLIQLYDGTLIISGNSTMIWHGFDLTHADIQVLPAGVRKYAGPG